MKMRRDSVTGRVRSIRSRLIRAITVVAAVVMCATVGLAAPASASVYGCTAGRGTGFVCGSVYGSGLYVSSVTVERHRETWPPDTNVCDLQGVVTVYNSGGSQIFQRKSAIARGCTAFLGHVDITVNAYFPNNSKITLSAYEINAYQGAVSFRLTQ